MRKKAVKARISLCRLLVNATPLGMNSSDPLPVDAGLLRPDLAVYDLVYNPRRTELLKAALRKKARAAGGQGMLVHQGAIACRLWTGKYPAIAPMRKALEGYLRNR